MQQHVVIDVSDAIFNREPYSDQITAGIDISGIGRTIIRSDGTTEITDTINNIVKIQPTSLTATNTTTPNIVTISGETIFADSSDNTGLIITKHPRDGLYGDANNNLDSFGFNTGNIIIREAGNCSRNNGIGGTIQFEASPHQDSNSIKKCCQIALTHEGIVGEDTWGLKFNLIGHNSYSGTGKKNYEILKLSGKDRVGICGKDPERNLDVSGTFRVTNDSKYLNINETGDVDINGDINITGSSHNLNGVLNVTGNSNITGNVDITGNSNITGDVDINGTVNITGDANIINTSAVKITNGSTAQRPTTSELGQIRYNNDIDHYEGYRKINEILSHWEQFVLPAGAIQHFAMQTAPSGWLICDGRAVLQSDYPKLYAAISNIYGTPTGDNAANEFLLPDFRGRFIRGWDDMGQGSAGNDLTANRVFGSVQEDDNKEHNHSGNTGDNGAHSHTFYMKADYCETEKRYGYCNHRAPNGVVGNAN